MRKPLCIYHGNCADGFGAAWAVRHALGKDNVEFYAGVHQDPPPDVIDRDVIIVDFSYKRSVIECMAKQANTILILDHHKSAAEALNVFSSVNGLTYEDWLAYALTPGKPHVGVLFDMNRSGARIAWDFFNPGKEAPMLIHHIEDRDLWRFAIQGTREVQAALFSFPYDFDVWDELMLSTDPQILADEGKVIERKHFKDINEFIEVAEQSQYIAGYIVPVLNAPYFWSSDACLIMGKNKPFAACYWDTPNGRVYSLRSNEYGIDVSEIAKLFGGGGHKHASGFRLQYHELWKLKAFKAS